MFFTNLSFPCFSADGSSESGTFCQFMASDFPTVQLSAFLRCREFRQGIFAGSWIVGSSESAIFRKAVLSGFPMGRLCGKTDCRNFMLSGYVHIIQILMLLLHLSELCFSAFRITNSDTHYRRIANPPGRGIYAMVLLSRFRWNCTNEYR